ncbi:MAG: hypothetical protein KTV68_02275 [Acidimicrobiia bacterium]|nr:hypothetical protein [Acidimicrobiia bacterium]MCY4432086.1 hypothetical protein [bacterium]
MNESMVGPRRWKCWHGVVANFAFAAVCVAVALQTWHDPLVAYGAVIYAAVTVFVGGWGLIMGIPAQYKHSDPVTNNKFPSQEH